MKDYFSQKLGMLFCFDTRRKEWKAKFKRGSEQFEIELTIDAEPSDFHTFIGKIENILEDYQRLPEGYLLQRLTEAEKKKEAKVPIYTG